MFLVLSLSFFIWLLTLLVLARVVLFCIIIIIISSIIIISIITNIIISISQDARMAANYLGFLEIVFADDFNCFKTYPLRASNALIMDELHECQTALHEWGAANQVVFDVSKQHFAVLSQVDSQGDAFKLLGILFDT